MQAQPQVPSTLSVKFGDQHDNLNTVLSLNVYLHQQRVAEQRKTLAEVFNKQIPQTCLIWKTKCSGDASEIKSYFINNILAKNFSLEKQTVIAVKNGQFLYMLFEGPPAPEIQTTINQTEPFIYGSIKVDQSAGARYNFFTNSVLEVNFKKSNDVWKFAEEILGTLGVDHFLPIAGSVYKVFKQLNLQVSFGSLNSLPPKFLEAVNKVFDQQAESNFDFNQIDENGNIFFFSGNVITVELDFKNKYISQFTRIIEAMDKGL